MPASPQATPARARRRRLSRRGAVARLTVTLVLALGGSGAAAATADTADTAVVAPQGEGPAVTAARGLADLGAADAADATDTADVTATAASWIAVLPASVRAGLGYDPVVVDGLPADPAGSCSSPVALPAGFTPACLTHDLGYDLLRVAAASGEDIPDGVRSGLDRQLTGRMADTCTGGPVATAGCRAVAEAAGAAVAVNTWRQGGGAPVTEHWPWS